MLTKIINFFAIIFLINWFIIHRAKKGKRTIIPLVIIDAISFLLGFLSLFAKTKTPYFFEHFLANSIFTMDILVIIFISDYIANKHKKG